MKTLQIHNYYRFSGGEEIMFEAISRMLRKKGRKVFIFERKSDNIQGLWGKICAFREGIYSNSSKKELSYILTREHPDVVHVHNVYPLISPSVLVACRQFDVPAVMTCHNYRFTCPTSLHLLNGTVCELCCDGREYWCVLKNCRGNILESIAYALRSTLARKLHLFNSNVTIFIALTEFARRRLVEAGFPEEMIVVVPNMVSIPDSITNSTGGRYVAFAGRISPEKGIDTLIAATRLTGLPVRLAGDGPILNKLVGRAPENAEFAGLLDTQKMAAFYRGARFLVLPSKWFEVCPMVIIEAMSHGLPVIASRIGGIPEIVEDGVTGFLFEPGNAKELAEKMKLLWENTDLCRQMGKAGREKAIREYSEDVYYERLMTVYKKAIEMNMELQR